MNNLLITAVAMLSVSSIFACEFTSLKVKVKVESRTVDYKTHKEKIETVGKLKGAFVRNTAGSFKVFQSKDLELPLTSLSFQERYDYYVSSIKTNVGLTGDTVANIISQAVGERKLKKHPELKAYVDSIKRDEAASLYSSFYKFSGSSYGEVDDETLDSMTLSDATNGDNELRISFDFKRYPKCN